MRERALVLQLSRGRYQLPDAGGAVATGLDFSAVALHVARQLAEETGSRLSLFKAPWKKRRGSRRLRFALQHWGNHLLAAGHALLGKRHWLRAGDERAKDRRE